MFAVFLLEKYSYTAAGQLAGWNATSGQRGRKTLLSAAMVSKFLWFVISENLLLWLEPEFWLIVDPGVDFNF